MIQRVTVYALEDKQADYGTRKRGNCYRCGLEGHFARDPECKARSVTYQKCKKTGHLTKLCRTMGEDKTKKGNVRHVTEDNDFAFTVQLGARDLPTVAIELGGVRLEGVLVDSGSTCNVIDRETWEVLRKKKIKRNCTLMARRNHSTLPVSLKLNCVVKIDNVLHVSLLWKRRQGQYPADRPLNCWQY